MSLDPRNCFSLAAQSGVEERGLNYYQTQWKSKALCRLYFNGDVKEKTFKRVFNQEHRNIYRTLEAMETRVDNLLFRTHLAFSVFQARKYIRDGGITVNGAPVKHPATMISPGDVVQVTPKFKDEIMTIAGSPYLKIWGLLPKYVEVNYRILAFVLVHRPKFSDIPSPYPIEMIEKMGSYYQRYSS